ncbi:MAG TPA: hypothetical protein VIW25_14810 [Nitrososphaeraceae archaeon]
MAKTENNHRTLTTNIDAPPIEANMRLRCITTLNIYIKIFDTFGASI